MSGEGPTPTSDARLPLALRVLLALAWIVGAVLRVDGVSREGLIGDEAHALRHIERGYAATLAKFDTLGSHTGFPLLQRVAVDFFGWSVASYRLPALLAGLAALLLAYPVGRALVGRRAAWVAALLLAVHPMHVYYSRSARSYSLAFLLALLLAGSLAKALESQAPWRWRWCVAVALTAGLAPFAHLSAAGVVVATGFASLWLSWRARRRLLDVGRCAAVFLSGGLLTLALFAPAWHSFERYVERVATRQQISDPSFTGMVTLLGGSFLGGTLLVVSALPAAFLLFRRAPAPAVLCVTAFLGPLVALMATRPTGMDYAYARYLLAAHWALLFLAGWGLVALAQRVALLRSQRAFVAAASVFVLVYGLAGPLFSPGRRALQFTNTYLALHDLPAFDEPFEHTPEFYRSLPREEPITLVEYPGRSARLLRNYALQHGQKVLIGRAEEPRLTGPYVSAKNEQALLESGAHFIVVHHQLFLETERYHAFVAEAFAARGSWWDRNLMAKFLAESVWGDVRVVESWLWRTFGEPFYRDAFLHVWKLEPIEVGRGSRDPGPVAPPERERRRGRRDEPHR